MGFVRINKGELNSVKTLADDLVKTLTGATEHASSLKSSAYENSASWSNNSTIVGKWKSYVKNHREGDRELGSYHDVKDEHGEVVDKEWKWDENAVESEARRQIAAAKCSYDEYAECLYSPGDSNDDANKVLSSLTSIISALEKFESESPSLEDALKTLKTLPEGFSVESMDIAIDGEVVSGVQVLVFTDSDGNRATVSELVNAFYTYTGTTIASNIAAEYYLGSDISPEKREEVLRIIGEKTKTDVNVKTSKGMFSVASDTGISGMYEAAMDEKYESSEVHNKYMTSIAGLEPEDVGKELSEQTNADRILAMGMAGLVSAALCNDPSELYDLPIDKVDTDALKKDEKDKDEEKDKILSDDDVKQKDKFEQLGDNEVLLEDIDGEGEEPIDGEVEDEEIEESDPELNPEEKVKIPDDVVKDIKDKIESNEDLVVSEEVEKPEITSDDIDNQARDKFYEEKTKGNPLDNELAQERMKAVEDYNNMSDDQKISALESLGYTGIAAAGLVADQAAGQTAYMIGLENQQLANISNDLAAQQGFMNHDTRYDDPIGMDYFSSGQASIDLTPVSKDVQVARTNLDQAKTQYDSSVTTANKAISDANASKEKYNNVLKNIRSTSGNNPKDWTEEQVKEYNKAAKEYNEAVDKANGAVKDANSKKADYAKSKEQYNVAYEKYRVEAEKALQQVKENDNADEIGTSVGEPPLPSGDDLGDTFVVGDELVIGNVSSGEQGSENPGNNNDDPIPDQTGIVYEEE